SAGKEVLGRGVPPVFPERSTALQIEQNGLSSNAPGVSEAKGAAPPSGRKPARPGALRLCAAIRASRRRDRGRAGSSGRRRCAEKQVRALLRCRRTARSAVAERGSASCLSSPRAPREGGSGGTRVIHTPAAVSRDCRDSEVENRRNP